MSKIDVLGVSSCLKTLNKFYLLYIPKYYVLQMSQEIDNFIQSLNEDGTSASDVSEMIPQKHHVPQPPFVALPAPQFHIPEMLTSCWKPIDPSNPCPLLQRVTMHSAIPVQIPVAFTNAKVKLNTDKSGGNFESMGKNTDPQDSR